MHSREQTLTDVLERRLTAIPDAEICRLVALDGTSEPITAQRLLDRVMAYAARFGPAGLERKIAAVCLYHGLDLHAAFLGALWAGHIPTMIAPPSPRMEPAKYSRSFAEMLRHVQPGFVVIDQTVREKLAGLGLGELPATTLIDPHEVVNGSHVPPSRGELNSIAVIQHSSGTTGLQKGVALSHRAINAHNANYGRALELEASDTIVSWLPLYHDMGFIACFLLPLLTGTRFVQISPFDWVVRPHLLLNQIHVHRGTLCWLPNFAFSFMAQTVRPANLLEGLDLSSMRGWINCSEPVLDGSFTEFEAAFKSYGVTRGQFAACYAMAENVFAMSQSRLGGYRTIRVDPARLSLEKRAEVSSAPEAKKLVSNGRPTPGTEIKVTDAAANDLPEGVVGEILIRGNHVFSGYFRRPDLTRESMTADGWFRTGDLGFLHGGEVFVTGRIKDIIIIQGRNFYPTDIEDVVGRISSVAAGRVVAFGVSDGVSGTEKMTILAELREGSNEDPKLVQLQIRNLIAQELDCTPGNVQIVPARWLVKSTAGKIARRENREKYLASRPIDGQVVHV